MVKKYYREYVAVITKRTTEPYHTFMIMSLEKKSGSIQKMTLGLSEHRSEMIPFSADWMRRHEAIFLEEPPDAGFDLMLTGALAVDDYLMQLDVEFPAFSKEMCYLLRKLKAEGKKIFQVEPYLEILLGIHEFFAEGHRPKELNKKSIQYPVYLAERNATGALLAFYQTSMIGSFEKTLEAVKQFARIDAARFRLRDSLRVQELAPLVKKYPSAYIEAGVMHYPLWRLLRRQSSPPYQLQMIFLADDALKTVGERGHLFGPGDQLTLFYIFHPGIAGYAREDLLAARSIIYSKIIKKEELNIERNTFPHLRDELDCIRTTKKLSLDDCRRLFPLVRRAGTAQAHQIVAEYIDGSKSPRRQRSKDINLMNTSAKE